MIPCRRYWASVAIVCLAIAVNLRGASANQAAAPVQGRSGGQAAELRVGIIGLDTSHVLRFTELLNDRSRPDHVPGARVIAAYRGGSPDVEASRTRIDKFSAEIRDTWGVEIVGSIEALCRQVDAVLLLSVDGRTHLEQVRPVFAARRPVFIDKPFAASLRDAREIVRLARESNTPMFSASSRRWAPDLARLKQDAGVGEIVGAFTYGPAPTEPHHPDLFWYGIHAVEALFTLMGPGCQAVTRTTSADADVVTCRWTDGRIGTMRGNRTGAQDYGQVVFGTKGIAYGTPAKAPRTTSEPSQYHGIVSAMVEFFRTGIPPVKADDTLEILAFMEAADLSKARGGAAVSLSELTLGSSR